MDGKAREVGQRSHEPEDLPEVHDLLSLVGWGKGEGEEAGAILRVVQALRIFCLRDERRQKFRFRLAAWALGILVLGLAGDVESESNNLITMAKTRRQQGILTGMPFMANIASRTFVDDLGRKIYMAKPPARVVSVAPSITEILFAIGAAGQVVGVTEYCDYPPEAREKPKIGYSHPNLETIVQLQPDLVLAPREFLRAEILAKLEQLKIATFILEARTIEDIPAHIQTIGRLVDRAERADQVATDLRQHIAKVRTRTEALPRPRVLYVLNSQPLITVGPGSFIHRLIELAGATNIADRAPSPYPRLNMEEVLKRDPEIIVFPVGGADRISEQDQQEWRRWNTVSAVRHGRLYQINADLLNRPGPRIGEGLDSLLRIIHPEVFETK